MTKTNKPVDRSRLWLLGGVILAASGHKCLTDTERDGLDLPPLSREPDGGGGDGGGGGGHN